MANVLLFLFGVFLGAIFGFLFGVGFKAAKISDLQSKLYYKDQAQSIEQGSQRKAKKWLPPDSQ